MTLLVDHPQKRRALLQPLAATGYVGLAAPISLLLQTPNWGEALLSTHRTRWWGYHYGVPAAATAVLGLMMGWRRLRQAGRDGARLPHYVVACALLTARLPPYRTPAGNRTSDLYQLSRSPSAAGRPWCLPGRPARPALPGLGRPPARRSGTWYHVTFDPSSRRLAKEPR